MIEEYLEKQGAEFEVIRHERAYTAQETAQVEDISGYEFAKTVVVTVSDGHCLLVLQAPYRVDLDKVSAVLGEEAELTPEDETKPLFPSCELGAEPPFGSVFEMPTIVESRLEEEEEIVFRAGTHEKTIKMPYVEYKRIEQPRVADFAAE